MAEQLKLIDVDDPKYKKIKEVIKEYDKLTDSNRKRAKTAREAEEEKRGEIFKEADAAKIKPDADGVIRVIMDGEIWSLEQKAQLKISKKEAPKPESESAEPSGEAQGGRARR